MECLNTSCEFSGQKVNYEKSKLFLSPNVDRGIAKELSLGSGIPLNSKGIWEDTLFGVPLLHERVTKKTYYYLLEKVQRRLSGWKAVHLSMAGRTVHAQGCGLGNSSIHHAINPAPCSKE